MWDVDQGVQIFQTIAHQSHVTQLEWIKNTFSSCAYSTSIDGTVKIWDFSCSHTQEQILLENPNKRSSKWILSVSRNLEFKLKSHVTDELMNTYLGFYVRRW